MKEIVCPNCSQNIKVVDTMGYDLYLENLKEKDKGITRLNNIIDKAVQYCNNNIEYCDRLVDIVDILNGEVNE